MIMDKQLEKFEEGTVYLWTDGACKGNPGPGGYAAYMFGWYTDKEGIKWVVWRSDMSGTPMTTNNRMELSAVVLGLSLISKNSGARVMLYSDAEYVVHGINEWLSGWMDKNGVKSDGDPVANWELWLHIDNFLAKHDIHAIHTKAHADDEWNNKVDEMAGWMIENPRSGPGGLNRKEGREQLTPTAGA